MDLRILIVSASLPKLQKETGVSTATWSRWFNRVHGINSRVLETACSRFPGSTITEAIEAIEYRQENGKLLL